MIPKVYISQMTFDESCYVRGNLKWRAETLYKYAKKQGLEPFDYPLVAFDQSTDNAFVNNNLRDFIFHMKRVSECDHNYPIILDGKETIKAIRLNDMPECDWVLSE